MKAIELTMVAVAVAVIAKYVWGLVRLFYFMFGGEE